MNEDLKKEYPSVVIRSDQCVIATVSPFDSANYHDPIWIVSDPLILKIQPGPWPIFPGQNAHPDLVLTDVQCAIEAASPMSNGTSKLTVTMSPYDSKIHHTISIVSMVTVRPAEITFSTPGPILF